MKNKYCYLVYRVYSEKERPGIPYSDRVILYGWSPSKDILKAFFEQREKKKYKVKKTLEEDVYIYTDVENLTPENMIDFVMVTSASTKEEIPLFITKNELRDTEVKIHEYFSDLCRLVDRDDGKTHLLELYINLDDYYLDPLQYLGFKPPEMDALFDSVEYRESTDSMYDIESLINSVYDESFDVPYEVAYHTGKIPGLTSMPTVSSKIIYSIESFIKALKEEM